MVCPVCGEFVQPAIERGPDGARCPNCAHFEPMAVVPLFIVTGPSGAGKTAVVGPLRRLLPEWEVFETDILRDSGGDWGRVKCNWLRIAHSIAQSGRGTILCGTILPEQIRDCDHRDCFSGIHYLGLLCEDEKLRSRLRARPEWRGCSEAFIEEQIRLSRWLREHADTDFDPPLTIIETTGKTVEAAAQCIRDWALERWPAGNLR
ncbi:MAG: hypothetical protein KY468_04570 [Armatimonadetes bacterium]|nr:hypothetical protein [Armatimonadota bacterium]